MQYIFSQKSVSKWTECKTDMVVMPWLLHLAAAWICGETTAVVIQDCWSYTCCFSWSLVSSSAILSLSVDITWEYVYLSWLNWCHSNGCMIFLVPCSNIFFFIKVRLGNSLADKWFSLIYDQMALSLVFLGTSYFWIAF